MNLALFTALIEILRRYALGNPDEALERLECVTELCTKIIRRMGLSDLTSVPQRLFVLMKRAQVFLQDGDTERAVHGGIIVLAVGDIPDKPAGMVDLRKDLGTPIVYKIKKTLTYLDMLLSFRMTRDLESFFSIASLYFPDITPKWDKNGNKVGDKNGNKVETSTPKWDKNGIKMETKWDQEPQSETRMGTKWEQEPQSGTRMGTKWGTKWEQSGSKNPK